MITTYDMATGEIIERSKQPSVPDKQRASALQDAPQLQLATAQGETLEATQCMLADPALFDIAEMLAQYR
jgi:uncharacterized protein YccT (UPF0319 family)